MKCMSSESKTAAADMMSDYSLLREVKVNFVKRNELNINSLFLCKVSWPCLLLDKSFYAAV